MVVVCVDASSVIRLTLPNNEKSDVVGSFPLSNDADDENSTDSFAPTNEMSSSNSSFLLALFRSRSVLWVC